MKLYNLNKEVPEEIFNIASNPRIYIDWNRDFEDNYVVVIRFHIGKIDLLLTNYKLNI